MSRPSRLHTVQGASSWRVANDSVEAFITQQGGHLAPVSFHTGSRTVQPFALPPWLPAEIDPSAPAVLRPLRGDFFCAPFGGNATRYRGEQHPLHGESASAEWQFVSHRVKDGEAELILQQDWRVRRGRITKRLRLRAGETVLYQEHVIEGASGPMSFGHHAMLAFAERDGVGRIATSRFRQGQVVPHASEDPAQGGYTSLKPAARFRSLRQVPLAAGGYADLTRFPAREGYTDLVQLCGTATHGPAWTTVTFPGAGWLWFALRNPRQLNSTILWHSHGGRHYPPWNGKHRRILGLEDVTSYFAAGLAESARLNPLSRQGIATTIQLHKKRALRIPYIMGVTRVPRGFDVVRRIGFGRDAISFHSTSGLESSQSLDLSFLENP